MSSHSKQQTKAGASSATFQQGQRNLLKRDFKQALKDARVCYRQSPAPDHRKLLEQASLGRARELDQTGLKPQAQDILQELLGQPVIDQEVRQQLPELLAKMGMLDRYPEFRQKFDADPELKARMVAQAADRAVLHLDQAKGDPPEIREGAALVLAAIDKLDAGLEAESFELLKDISRQSPFADWRLFIRGLAAHHRSDSATCDANWSRLDPDRMPFQLTRLVKAISQPDMTVPADPKLANAVAGLEGVLWGAPLLSDLRHLKARAGAGEWSKAVTILRNVRERLRAADPLASQALSGLIRNQAIRSKNLELLKELTTGVDPLVWDPNWNHARAQLLESFDDWNSREVVGIWTRFLQDVKDLTCWSPEEVELAQALIYKHIGQIHSEIAAEYIVEDEIVEPKTLDPVVAGIFENADWDALETDIPRIFFVQKAEAAFNASLELRPDLIPTYHQYIELWKSINDQEQAAVVQRRLLVQFPNDLKALRGLKHYHEVRQEFKDALAMTLRQLEAKPLDEELRRECWSLRVKLFRQYYSKRNFAAAAAELDALKLISANAGQECVHLVLRALLEYSDGGLERLQNRLVELQETVKQPFMLWFFLLLEARLNGLPKDVSTQFRPQLQDAMALPFDPLVAGWIAEFLVQLDRKQLNHPEISILHVGFNSYLKNGKKHTFDLNGLKCICGLMAPGVDANKGTKTLLEHYLKKGRGLFRESGYFTAMLGIQHLKLEEGKRDLDYAIQLLNEARDKLTKSSSHDDKLLLEIVEEHLNNLNEQDDEEDDESPSDDPASNVIIPELGVSERQFSLMMRQELEVQIALRKKGKTLQNLSFKEFEKLMTSGTMATVCERLADRLKVAPEMVAEFFHKFVTGGDEDESPV